MFQLFLKYPSDVLYMRAGTQRSEWKHHFGTCSGHQGLTVLLKVGAACLHCKANKEASWRKGKFALCCGPANGGAGGLLLKGQLPPWTTRDQSFSRQREGLHAETAQSAGRDHDVRWTRRGLTGVILMVLSPVCLQSQGQCVPISLRPVLRMVAADVVATVWSSGC